MSTALLSGSVVLVGGGLAYAWPHVFKIAQVHRLRQACRRFQTLVLTYDDGPGPRLTPQLLDMLAAYGVRASFFPTARSAGHNPAGLSAVLAAGHEVGCHSASHLHPWRAAPWRTVSDIREGYAGLAEWTPARALFRPPYGKINLWTWLALRRRGAPLAFWTVDSGDTHANLPEAKCRVEHVRREGGGVVLMHDFDRDPPNDVARAGFVLRVTELLLQAARREGWGVQPLGELLRCQ